MVIPHSIVALMAGPSGKGAEGSGAESRELLDLTSEDGEECSGSESESGRESVSRPFILDKLRAPMASKLTRKRKVATNRVRGGQRRKVRCSSSSSEPKSIKPVQHIKQFPGEHLTVSRGKLFRRACHEEVT